MRLNKQKNFFKTNIFKIGAIVPELSMLNIEIFKKLNLIDSNYKTDTLPKFFFNSKDNIELSQKEIEFIKKHPNITLASGESFEPLIFKNLDGTFSGHDVDIANIISERTGLKINFEVGNWKEIQKRSIKREYDGLISAGFREDRLNHYNTSEPYIKLSSLVFVKSGNPKNITTIKGLSGKRAAIQRKNSLFENILKKHTSDVEIVYVDSMHDMLRAVVSNKADFTIVDDTAFYVLDHIGLRSMIEVPFTIGKPFDMPFYLRKDYPELVSIINKGLNNITVKEKKDIKKDGSLKIYINI